MDPPASEQDNFPLDDGSSPSLSLEAQPFDDIGAMLDPTKSVDSLYQVVSNLSKDEKCALLYDHIRPPSVLPTTSMRGSNRKFNVSWLIKYPWLLYSPKLDGVFCGPCDIFLPSSTRRDKVLLVNRPYSNWSKLSNALRNHSRLEIVFKILIL